MKLITLHNPWASAMAHSIKKVESRGWPCDHRGKLAIHAALSWNADSRAFAASEECWRAMAAPLDYNPNDYGVGFHNQANYRSAVLRNCLHNWGCVVAVCDMIDCLPTESKLCLPAVFADYPDLDTPMERAFGNYEPGRYGFVTTNMRLLREPIPFKSRQGKLIDWDPPANLEDLYA